jgi:hypothetical protein
MTPSLFGENNEFEIRPAGELIVETVPNKNITFAFKVTNKSARQEFTSDISLPEGWKAIVREFPFTLDQNQTDLRLISFYVPQAAAVGKYEVTYRIRGRQFNQITDYSTCTVVVAPFRKLTIGVLQAPESVIAGDRYKITLQIFNESNICDDLELKIDSPVQFRALAEVDRFQVPSGQSRIINVYAETDAKNTQPMVQTIRYAIHCADQKESQAETQSNVHIIPRIQGVEDRYFRLPAEISGAYVIQQVHDKTNQGFQGKAVGMGSLDPKGEKNVSFSFRGPDAYRKSLSVFAERDEYTASFWTKRFAVHAGDRAYSSTQLLQYSRYGRGVEMNVSTGAQTSCGLYYQESLYYMSKNKSAASFLKYQPNANSVFQLNYLNTSDADQKGQVLSASANLHPYRDAALNVELAQGLHEGKSENGLQIQFSGSSAVVSYQMGWIYASPDFPGYYRDTDYLSSGLVLRPLKNLSLNLEYQNSKENIDQDTVRFSAPLNRYFQTGLNYQTASNTRFSYDFISRSTEDRLQGRRFNYRETTNRFQLYQNLKKLSLSASAEIGETLNRLYGTRSDMTRYNVSLYFQPNSRQNYSGYVNVDHSNRYSDKKTKSVTSGLNIRYLLTDRADLRLSYQNAYSPEDYYSDRNTLEATFRYTLPNHHAIQLRARNTILRNSMDEKDKAVVVEYTAPIGIPIGVKQNSCIVRGTVYDAETMAPMKNLLIRINGSTAVTDHAGHFTFRNLMEKTYFLTIDKAAMGFNRVTVKNMPMEIQTVPGKTGKTVEIGVTRGVSISGRVRIVKTGENGSPDQSPNASDSLYVTGGQTAADTMATRSGIQNILVEVTQNGEALHRVTDSKGNFIFDELRPGAWRVKFYDYNMPEYHRFERNTFELNLRPGGSEMLDVRVVPQKRRIKMLQSGEVDVKEQKEQTITYLNGRSSGEKTN